MKDDKVYELLKKISEQNVKPHMAYLVLNEHEDGELHRGIELVKAGYDTTEVYDAIEMLVAKGDLTRHGKQTRITKKGTKILRFVNEIVDIAEKIVIS